MFVPPLDQTAVHTYTNIVTMTKTPGTKLHTAWKDTPAPQAAIDYWRLPADAMWVDCLKRMLADESHHRDVNHAMASMTSTQLALDPSRTSGRALSLSARCWLAWPAAHSEMRWIEPRLRRRADVW
jgi:hypothetical protein